MHAKVADTLRRVAFQRSLAHRSCSHLEAGQAATTDGTRECLACTEEGTTWLALRKCQTCGSVGCCDGSAGKHARGHFESTGHPIIRPVEQDETWAWCYVDQAYLS